MSRQVRITHSPEVGTVLAGTRRGDGAWSMLRGTWEWQSTSSSWLLVGSPGQKPNLVTIRRTCRALTLIGFTVTDLTDTWATDTPAAQPK